MVKGWKSSTLLAFFRALSWAIYNLRKNLHDNLRSYPSFKFLWFSEMSAFFMFHHSNPLIFKLKMSTKRFLVDGTQCFLVLNYFLFNFILLFIYFDVHYYYFYHFRVRVLAVLLLNQLFMLSLLKPLCNEAHSVFSHIYILDNIYIHTPYYWMLHIAQTVFQCLFSIIVVLSSAEQSKLVLLTLQP